MITVILDEPDVDRLLRALYHGTRPRHVHTLICACGALADLRDSETAWIGWQVLPWAICPGCLEKERLLLIRWQPSFPARQRFLDELRARRDN
jgi:hypothetical protein